MKDSVVKLLKEGRGRLLELPGCQAALVSLREGREGAMVVRTARGFEDRELELLSGGRLLAEGEEMARGVLILDAEKDRFKDQQTGFRSCLCVPIRADSRTIGCLMAINRERPGAFDYNQLARVEAYAEELAEQLEREDWAGTPPRAQRKTRPQGRLAKLVLAPLSVLLVSALYVLFLGGAPAAKAPTTPDDQGVRVNLEGRVLQSDGAPVPSQLLDRGRFVIGTQNSKVTAQVQTRGDGEISLRARPSQQKNLRLFLQVPGYRPYSCEVRGDDLGELVLEPRRRSKNR